MIIASLILLIITFLLQYLARTTTMFAKWYVDNIYHILVRTIGSINGYIPFSIVEIGLYILIIYIIYKLYRFVSKIIKKEEPLKYGKVMLKQFVLIASILAFTYTVGCGINYFAPAFSLIENISTANPDDDQLMLVAEVITKQLVETANEYKEDNEVLVLDCNVSKEAKEALHQLIYRFPSLNDYYPSAKGVTVSWILSIQQIEGIYSPFTIEANYNKDMPDCLIPFAVCHELSHLNGYMREDEANLISFLACTSSPNWQFKYSGYYNGFIYLTNQLYRLGYTDKVRELYGMLPECVLKDLKDDSDFWDKYDGKISELQSAMNDNYLKTNGQSEGVKTYSRVVNLIVDCYINNR